MYIENIQKFKVHTFFGVLQRTSPSEAHLMTHPNGPHIEEPPKLHLSHFFTPIQMDCTVGFMGQFF